MLKLGFTSFLVFGIASEIFHCVMSGISHKVEEIDLQQFFILIGDFNEVEPPRPPKLLVIHISAVVGTSMLLDV